MNESIFYFLNQFAGRSDAIDSVFIFLANNFGYVLLLALVYFIVTHENREHGIREAAIALFVAGFAWTVSEGLNYIFLIERPFAVLPDVTLIFPHEADYAFPSGHTTFYFALATALYFYRKPIGFIVGLGTVLLGLARVISGVHWPLDILGGFAVGLAVSVLVIKLLERWSGVVADS